MCGGAFLQLSLVQAKCQISLKSLFQRVHNQMLHCGMLACTRGEMFTESALSKGTFGQHRRVEKQNLRVAKRWKQSQHFAVQRP